MPKIRTAVGRSVEEWVGASPDAKIPENVRLRIWDRCEGKDYFTGRKIVPPGDKYEFHHKVELADGGEHRESNIVLALKIEHKKASGKARTDRAAVRETRKAHLNLRDDTNSPIPSRPKPAKPPARPGANGVSEIARRYQTSGRRP